MSQSEDYLDGLLNSINKAKTDTEQIAEEAKLKQAQMKLSRTNVAPDDDFFTATGIDEAAKKLTSTLPYNRKAYSEDDFLKEFEEELLNGKADAFINAFEREIDEEERIFQETGEVPEAQSVVDSLLDNIDNIVLNAKKQLDDGDIELTPDFSDDDIKLSIDDETDSSEDLKDEDDYEVNTLDSDMDMDFLEEDSIEEEPLEEDSEEADENQEDSLDDLMDLDIDTLNLDSPLEIDEEPLEEEADEGPNIMDEFAPDENDEKDMAEFGDGEEEFSLEGALGLDSLLDSDDDLADIKSILDGDDLDEFDINEDAEELEPAEEAPEEDAKGKKGKKEKKPKKEKKENEKLNAILLKVKTVLFGPIDEEEEAQEKFDSAFAKANKRRKKDPTAVSDEDKAILEKGGSPITEEEIAAFENKKKEEEAKKKAKAEKKAEKPEKEKPKKEKKPKKPKKVKEPDNSPKIPLSIIVVFLVLSISIIGAVVLLMNYMGIQRHMAQANDLYEQRDYIAAYEKLNGLDLSSEEDILTRNRARCLADLQQCQDEYIVFIDRELYDFALDSLIKGVGRYEKFKEEAEELGISEQYKEYCDTFETELKSSFGLSKEDALNIFNQKNRHYYTVELRKVLIDLGLED